jgi:epsilon-lactone hydrolase
VREHGTARTYGDRVRVPGPEVGVAWHVPFPHRTDERAMTRRPQVPMRAMRAGVRGLVRPVLGPRVPVGVQRRWLAAVTRPTPLAEDVAIRPGRLGRRPAETLTPSGGDPTTAVLYLHGGGFTTGSPATHRALATHLAAATGATVHVLDYRLAPEHPFPAALDDVLVAYRELLDRGATPARTALAGDSAGGWLVLSAALRLRTDGDRLPAVLGLISPWLDLTGASWPPGRVDPMLRRGSGAAPRTSRAGRIPGRLGSLR